MVICHWPDYNKPTFITAWSKWVPIESNHVIRWAGTKQTVNVSCVSLFFFNALGLSNWSLINWGKHSINFTLTVKPYQGPAKLHQILWPQTRALKGLGKTLKTTDWNKELGTPPCPQLSWKDFLTTCWNKTGPLAFLIYSRSAKQSNTFRNVNSCLSNSKWAFRTSWRLE